MKNSSLCIFPLYLFLIWTICSFLFMFCSFNKYNLWISKRSTTQQLSARWYTFIHSLQKFWLWKEQKKCFCFSGWCSHLTVNESFEFGSIYVDIFSSFLTISEKIGMFNGRVSTLSRCFTNFLQNGHLILWFL